MTSRYAVFETCGGFCGIAWSDAGITRFQLPTSDAEVTERLLVDRLSNSDHGVPPLEVAKAIEAAARYFSGEPVDFTSYTLDLHGVSGFFRQVYDLTRKIGWGHTTTYGRLAKELDEEPQAARKVGRAMAKNPVALIIPCHRVVAVGGKLGGFSAPGGVISKARMLELEGVRLASLDPEQKSLEF